jgi:hypothetical protein
MRDRIACTRALVPVGRQASQRAPAVAGVYVASAIDVIFAADQRRVFAVVAMTHQIFDPWGVHDSVGGR